MVTVNEKWCSKCGKRTIHNYVGSKSDFEGYGIARVFVAVTSLGFSEVAGRAKYWQCSKCGKLTKK